MPRRVNPIRDLNARAAKGELPEPTPQLQIAPSEAETEQGFDFARFNLYRRAHQLAISMRGRHYLNYRQGRLFVRKIVDHLEAGEELKVQELRQRYQHRYLINNSNRSVSLSAVASIFPGSGL